MTTANPEPTVQVTFALLCGRVMCPKSPVTGGLHVYQVVSARVLGTMVRCQFCGAGAYYYD